MAFLGARAGLECLECGRGSFQVVECVLIGAMGEEGELVAMEILTFALWSRRAWTMESTLDLQAR